MPKITCNFTRFCLLLIRLETFGSYKVIPPFNMPKNERLIRQFGTLILASSSPRRAQLLEQIGFDFKIVPSRVEETFDHADPATVARTLAEQKAEDVAVKFEDQWVLVADTVVALNGRLLGKPKDPSDASEMLHFLSGQTHEVMTGFSFIHLQKKIRFTDYERTWVTFRKLSEREITEYIDTGSAADKAGAYGIQDMSAVFVEKIDGDFYNVVGLPITKIYTRLHQLI